MKASYHTHSDFCDGKATIEAMAEAAIAEGYRILGFSSHNPLPFPYPDVLPMERLGEYRDAVRALAARLEGRIEIRLGVEADWVAGVCAPGDERLAAAGFDYRIGSVHAVPSPGPGGGPPERRYTAVDSPAHEFARRFAVLWAGDGVALARAYFKAVTELARAGGFEVLGHFDLIRKNNRGSARFIDEDSKPYVDAAMEAVEAVAASGAVVEINTGGMARGKSDSPYPALRWLREFRARGVAVQVNADAHAPSHLADEWRRAGLEAAREAGYRELRVLSAGNWMDVGLE
jgi:histidinol-phosphatase (PHP family)